MKPLLIGLVALGSLAMMTSCDESARLASKIEGTWSSTPARIADQAPYTTTLIDNITFARSDNDKSGGTLTLHTLLSTNFPTEASTVPSSTAGAYSMTVSGSADIVGSWKAIDDDEINVVFDTSTLVVNVDPDAIVMTDNAMGQPGQAEADALKAYYIDRIKLHLTQALQMRYLSIREFDDIKVKDNVMRIEIADQKFDFTRLDTIPAS